MLRNDFFKRFGYPILISLFFIGVAGAFAFSLRFLAAALNKALDPTPGTGFTVSVDIESANFASKHLGVSANPVVDIPEPEPVTPTPEAAPAASKNTLSVSVLNSTSTSGLALALRSELLAAGFVTVTAGNTSPALESTEIRAKPGMEALVQEIASVVEKRYVLGPTVSLPSTATNDIVIVIGAARK